MKKNLEGITNNQGQVISQKKINRRVRKEKVQKAIEENASFFAEVRNTILKYLPKIVVKK